jgi:hypothetical protein
MRDLREDLREYIDLRRALGYKLRKHEPRLSEFITFLGARRTNHITAKLAIAWATESSKGHKHSGFERLSFIRSFATYVSAMDSNGNSANRRDAPAGHRSPAVYLYTGRDRPAHGSGAQPIFTAQTPLSHVLPSDRITRHDRHAQRRSGSTRKHRRELS